MKILSKIKCKLGFHTYVGSNNKRRRRRYYYCKRCGKIRLRFIGR